METPYIDFMESHHAKSGKRYRNLLAWKACDHLVMEVYRVSTNWPNHELYGLISQSRRAAFSAASNIAEGSGKRGYRELRRYLDISLGSLSELSYALSVACRLGYLSEQAFIEIDECVEKAGRITFGFARSIDRKVEEAKIR